MRKILGLGTVLATALLACKGAQTQPPMGGVTVTSCMSDSDCTDPAAPSCINNICAAAPMMGTHGIGEACTADSDCLEGLVCDNGKCDVTGVGPGGKCKETDDCNQGLMCVMNVCTAGDAGVPCNDNGDCGGNGMVCQNGTCVAGTGGDDGGVGCNDTSDCTMGQVCLNGQCVAGSATDGSVPMTCNDNGDCGPGQLCANSVCTVATTTDMGVKPTDAAAPSSCNDNSDCGTGQTCQSGVCVSTNTNLDAGTSCTSDSQCGTNYICKKGKCSPGCVIQPSKCWGGYVCNPTTNRCQPPGTDGGSTSSDGGTTAVDMASSGGQVGDSCTVDSDCAPQLICNKGGLCVDGCVLRPANCWGGYVCNTTTNHCQPPSTDM